MKRQIKFCGYSDQLKQWIYGYPQIVEAEGKEYGYIFWQGHAEPVDVDSIRQFTESKYEKVEIYDGDVIKRIDTGDTKVVMWNKDGYVARAVYDSWLKCNVLDSKRDVSLHFMTKFPIEVIGNTYTNPELIK